MSDLERCTQCGGELTTIQSYGPNKTKLPIIMICQECTQKYKVTGEAIV